MIVSASRRTDIPRFYFEWFLNRLADGFVLVRNPMNFHQVSRVPDVYKRQDHVLRENYWHINSRSDHY